MEHEHTKNAHRESIAKLEDYELEKLQKYEEQFRDDEIGTLREEVQSLRQQLENEKASHLEQCTEFRLKIQHLQQELNQFKALCHEQTTAISAMKINSAQQIKQNTELNHQINKQNIQMEELKLENELKSHSLVQQIENDNDKLLKKMYESFPVSIAILFEMN